MMKRRSLSLVIGAGVALMLVTQEAHAWSETVRRAIASTAIQLIRREQPAAFKTTSLASHSSARDVNVNYEEDVLRGASQGPRALSGYALDSDAHAIAAVGSEIQLLRTVRQYGMGSYFAYRMGALSALVSELMLPYSLDNSPQGVELRQRMESDIDANFSKFRYSASNPGRRYIRTPQDYFRELRTFASDDRRIIADDYAHGRGYRGMLAEAGEVYFARSVESVADAWHTVLRPQPLGAYTPPSDKVVAWYFVNEIDYLLNVKKNLFQAEKTYQHFEAVNPGLYDAYDRVGDLFYGFGTDAARERGVREWKIAYQHPGPQRARSAAKLTTHYLAEGEEHLDASQKPGASEVLLETALTSFKHALEFDRTNALAAQRINDTTVAIEKKRERRQFQDSLLAQGTRIVSHAQNSQVQGDFGTAIHTYNQAASIFDAVTDEFTDLERAANEALKQVEKGKRDVVNMVLEAADAKIVEGDRLVDARDFENAKNVYNYVEAIVQSIPEGEGERVDKEKQDTIARAQQKVRDAVNAQARWEEQQRAASG
jgi:hypothetical protein